MLFKGITPESSPNPPSRASEHRLPTYARFDKAVFLAKEAKTYETKKNQKMVRKKIKRFPGSDKEGEAFLAFVPFLCRDCVGSSYGMHALLVNACVSRTAGVPRIFRVWIRYVTLARTSDVKPHDSRNFLSFFYKFLSFLFLSFPNSIRLFCILFNTTLFHRVLYPLVPRICPQ